MVIQYNQRIAKNNKFTRGACQCEKSLKITSNGDEI